MLAQSEIAFTFVAAAFVVFFWGERVIVKNVYRLIFKAQYSLGIKS